MIDINNLNQNEEKNKSILNLLNLIKNQFPSMTEFSLMSLLQRPKEQFENVYNFLSKLNELNLNNDFFNYLPNDIFKTSKDEFENIFIFLDYIKKMNISSSDIAPLFFDYQNKETIKEFSKKITEEKEAKQRRRNSFTLFKKQNEGCYYAKFTCYNDQNQKFHVKKATGKFDKLEASKWAEEKRDFVIGNYLKKKYNIKDLFSNFWKKEKSVFNGINASDIKTYDTYINNYVIPFLWDELNRRNIEDIEHNDIEKLKNFLLNDLTRTKAGKEIKGLSPKSTNNILSCLRKMFYYFEVEKGIKTKKPMEANFHIVKSNYKTKERNAIPAKCFKNVFTLKNDKWKNELFYSLCLVGFNTGMRNSEISRIHIDDIEIENGFYFLNVRGTKTENAIRKIPITNFCYEKLNDYYSKYGDKETKKIFKANFQTFSNAIKNFLEIINEDLTGLHITFYSLRHTYKTILASSSITKDIAEYLMGHSNKSGVDKTYIDYKTFDIEKTAEKINKIFEDLF